MLWVPQKGRVQVAHNTGNVGATSVGTAVTTGGAAGTKGAVAEIFAATPFDAYRVRIIATRYSLNAAAAPGCLDILRGGATEDMLIPNLLMGYCGGNATNQICGPKIWDFPLYIPAGTRIAAQAAGLLLSTDVRVWVFLEGGDGMPKGRIGSKVTTYGIAGVPNGTAIVPGASGAEGAWTQIAASTSEAHFALVPSFQPTNVTSLNDKYHQVDLGLGAATEDEIANYWFFTQASEQMGGPWNSWPTFIDIPQGTRLAMRASCSGTIDAGGFDAAIHAVS